MTQLKVLTWRIKDGVNHNSYQKPKLQKTKRDRLTNLNNSKFHKEITITNKKKYLPKVQSVMRKGL